MKSRYLEITYLRGKPIAAYLYLPRRAGAKVRRTAVEEMGLKVDFDEDGTVMGIEITAPAVATLPIINDLLRRLGQPDLPAEEWAPARAA